MSASIRGSYRRTRYGDEVLVGNSAGLSGPYGFFISIIEMARMDFLFPLTMTDAWPASWFVAGYEIHESAITFFLSDWYRQILECLSLPTDWLPDGITEPRLKYELAKIRDRKSKIKRYKTITFDTPK